MPRTPSLGPANDWEGRLDLGELDEPGRSVADDEASGVIIADAELRWLYHPYDGGADVIAATTRQRDQLMAEFSDWLSRLPGGL